MKVRSFIIILLFLFEIYFSQEKDLKKGWYYGPNISTVIIDGYYSIPGTFSSWSSYFNSYYSISGGIDAMYAFGRKHTLTFGIQYQELHTAHSYKFEVDPLNNPGSLTTKSEKYSAKQLLLPVHMDFCLLKGKISPYIITGLIPQILFESKYIYRTTPPNGYIQETTYYDNGLPYFSILRQIGLGLDVNLKESKFRLFVYDISERPISFNYFGSKGFSGWLSVRGGISYYLKTSHH